MTSTAVVPAGEVEDDFGLGDVNTNVVPRVSVLKDGTFKNDQTGEVFSTLNCVVLGLVKQRVLWPAVVSEGVSKPLCRSIDSLLGNPSTEFPKSMTVTGTVNEDGSRNCADCPAKDWGSHPGRDVPWCSEQLVLPILIDGEAPALLTFQRASSKVTNAYLSDFKRRKTGAFVNVTTITLEAHVRGQVEYATPIFAKGEATDVELHPFYRETFLGIRSFLTTPRADNDEADSDAPASTSSSPQASTLAKADDFDEEPF